MSCNKSYQWHDDNPRQTEIIPNMSIHIPFHMTSKISICMKINNFSIHPKHLRILDEESEKEETIFSKKSGETVWVLPLTSLMLSGIESWSEISIVELADPWLYIGRQRSPHHRRDWQPSSSSYSDEVQSSIEWSVWKIIPSDLRHQSRAIYPALI